MPTFILKATPDRDLYVEWSTVVDNLIRLGTRAEFLVALAARDPKLVGDPLHSPEARLVRADIYGTSAMWPARNSPLGGWDDDLMVEQRGILRRGDLLAYVARMEADYPAKAYELLAPFDDELPAERCACGLVSRGLVDGVCADCRDRRAEADQDQGCA